MPRSVSLNMRTALGDENTSEVLVVLCRITHPLLSGGPLLLSTDPTERITSDPLVYGTRSQGEVYYFTMISALLPDDVRGASPSISLVFEIVTRDLVKIARSVRSPADLELRLVRAASPNYIEQAFTKMKTRIRRYSDRTMTIEASRDSYDRESYPAHRPGPSRFPGMYR
jgi:hypothetical protein